MSAFIDLLMDEAARVGFVEALRRRPGLTVEQLRRLCEHGGATKDLHRLSLRQLTRPHAEWTDAELEQEILAYFSRHPDREHSAAYFGRRFEIPRWRAQRLLGQLAVAGHLGRRGKTGGTRFHAIG